MIKDLLIRSFMFVNFFWIRLSRGKVGSKLGTQTILLLHTVGRKSGKPRVTPIAYFDYEGKYLIVASNWGRDKNADWYFNLKKQSCAALEVKGKKIEVQSRETQGEEYNRLWKFATERHPPYLEYQKMTSRHIPIMIFEAV